MLASKAAWQLDASNTEAFLRGLAIMGTGGGGSAAFGRAIIRNDIARGRNYDLVHLNQVPDNALVISGGIMGSVKVLDRFSPEQIVAQWEKRFESIVALRAMEDHLGRRVDYLVPFELGGLNTPVILSLGARLGILAPAAQVSQVNETLCRHRGRAAGGSVLPVSGRRDGRRVHGGRCSRAEQRAVAGDKLAGNDIAELAGSAEVLGL